MHQTRKNGPYTPEERRFMQNFNSQTYHLRHKDARNAKTRTRMAALRLREGSLPQAEQDARQEARQASAKKYRERNAWRLAQNARASREKARVAREEQLRQAEHIARRQRRQKRLQGPSSEKDDCGAGHSLPDM